VAPWRITLLVVALAAFILLGKKQRALVDARNTAESTVHGFKDDIEKYGDKVPPEEKTKVEDAIKLIKTHSDHRMAMAFAPLAVKYELAFDDIDCVEKSFPNFWVELQKCNFEF
jgi:3-phosphoshikimate 1-carboxyvinyltransferase